MGRRPASSLLRETGRAPAAYVNGASLLSRDFIDFLCKQRNISLFLSSIFSTTVFALILSLSLNLSHRRHHPEDTLDPTGAGPRQCLSLSYFTWYDSLQLHPCHGNSVIPFSFSPLCAWTASSVSNCLRWAQAASLSCCCECRGTFLSE